MSKLGIESAGLECFPNVSTYIMKTLLNSVLNVKISANGNDFAVTFQRLDSERDLRKLSRSGEKPRTNFGRSGCRGSSLDSRASLSLSGEPTDTRFSTRANSVQHMFSAAITKRKVTRLCTKVTAIGYGNLRVPGQTTVPCITPSCACLLIRIICAIRSVGNG